MGLDFVFYVWQKLEIQANDLNLCMHKRFVTPLSVSWLDKTCQTILLIIICYIPQSYILLHFFFVYILHCRIILTLLII